MTTTKIFNPITSIDDFEAYLISKTYKSYLTIEIPGDGYYADLRDQLVDANDFTQTNLPMPSKVNSKFINSECKNDFVRIGFADVANPDILMYRIIEEGIMSSQYDALTKTSFTVKIVGPSFAQRIEGEGWFIIPGAGGDYVSFCKAKKDCCLGDIASDIIPDYSNEDYIRDYGPRLLGGGFGTVEEYCRKNLRIRKP